MQNQSANNKRIAKNTMYLYVRMLVSLVVQLYTSRVILDALGASDYGIYNVVGGMVTMFAFMSNTMATAAQRFMSYALGRQDMNDLSKTFVVSTIIMWVIAVIVFVLVEIVGIYFLYYQLSIPDNRMVAAFWVFQFSVISLFVTIISVPYNAALIAHERVSAFAGFGLVDIFLRLGVAILLIFLSGSVDRLIVYSGLLMFISILLRVMYTVYCKRHFEECSGNKYSYDKGKGKQMLSFFGWNTIGSLSYVAKEQGVNILINVFFGTIVNAARGITTQVTGTVQGFISNFQLAMNPQITKYYAQGDFSNLFNLVQRGAKFSLLLYFFLALPLFLDLDYILNLWLVDVPEHTLFFIRLTFILMIIESLSSPVITCLLAVGKVKWYQIIVGGLLILNLPISGIALKMGCAPEVTIQVAIVISVLSLIVRLCMLKLYIGFPIFSFASNVILKSLIVIILSTSISYAIYTIIPFYAFPRLLFTCIESWIIALVLTYCVGLNRSEREMVLNMVRKFLTKVRIR